MDLPTLKIPILAGDGVSATFKKVETGLDRLHERTEALHSSFTKLGAGMEALGAFEIYETGLADLPKLAMDYYTALARLGTNVGLTGQNLSEYGKGLREVAVGTGQAIEEVMALSPLMLKVFGKEGSLTVLTALGEAATATGYKLDELGPIAKVLNQHFGVQAGGMANALGVVIDLSRKGNVTLSDMGNGFQMLSSRAEMVGIKGPNALRQLVAALQTVEKVSGGPMGNPFSTMSRMFDALVRPGMTGELARLGRQGIIPLDSAQRFLQILRTSKDPLHDFVQFFSRISGAGDSAKLGYFFQGRSLTAMQALIKGLGTYDLALKNTVNGQADLQAHFNDVMMTPGKAFEEFKVRLKETGLDALEPFFLRLGDAMYYVNHHAWAMKGIFASLGLSVGGGSFFLLLPQLVSAAATLMAGGRWLREAQLFKRPSRIKALEYDAYRGSSSMPGPKGFVTGAGAEWAFLKATEKVTEMGGIRATARAGVEIGKNFITKGAELLPWEAAEVVPPVLAILGLGFLIMRLKQSEAKNRDNEIARHQFYWDHPELDVDGRRILSRVFGYNPTNMPPPDSLANMDFLRRGRQSGAPPVRGENPRVDVIIQPGKDLWPWIKVGAKTDSIDVGLGMDHGSNLR